MDIDETHNGTRAVQVPPFTPPQLLQFPFFDKSIEEYLNQFGESALLSRDDNIKKVNACVGSSSDKFRPAICSTTRGVGKTAFIEAIGMQKVKPELKNSLITEAISVGRILSLDFCLVCCKNCCFNS